MAQFSELEGFLHYGKENQPLSPNPSKTLERSAVYVVSLLTH